MSAVATCVLLLFIAGIIITAVMIFTAVRNGPGQSKDLTVLIVLLCVQAAAFILYISKIYLFIIRLEKRVAILRREYMERSEPGIESDDVLETLQYLMRKDAIMQVRNREAEIEALQSQINPHFLYNTLETIRGQSLVAGNRQIADLTKALADIFRYNISQKGNIIKLGEELDNLCAYMKIQEVRFEGRFRLVINCADELRDYRIPKLSLQPVVENSIKHGLEAKIEGGTISIDVTASQSTLYIVVADDGVGMSIDHLRVVNRKIHKQIINYQDSSGTHLGLENINDRIRMLYGENYGIAVESIEGRGTKVILRMGLLTE